MTTKEKLKSKWNKRTQCSAIHCKNYQCDSTNVAFHRFPKDPDRCARWVLHLRNASLMGISSQLYLYPSRRTDGLLYGHPLDLTVMLCWGLINIPEGVLPKRVLDLLSEMRPLVSPASTFDHDGSVLVYIAGYMASKNNNVASFVNIHGITVHEQ
ncbi:hypothetical protein DPX16_23223 [Anabarilius grahami]|uniref:THAP-type domain-containing protein n=1 Tax=Anabarilius grahami TaxID=495550 RepID=A0A3N0YS83_ANAGA|nr:hypothetical protein DPX16_23223 [Anabarilius grahami]